MKYLFAALVSLLFALHTTAQTTSPAKQAVLPQEEAVHPKNPLEWWYLTGHLKDGTMDLDWDMLCRPRQTIVIYMGLKGLVTLCEQMKLHGLPGDTPAAIVQQGTTLEPAPARRLFRRQPLPQFFLRPEVF